MPFTSPNYTQVPNDLLGYFQDGQLVPGLLADMSGSELKVLLALSRLTFGFHREHCEASLTVLESMTGLSRPSVLAGAAAAEERGLIRKITDGQEVTAWEMLVKEFNQAEVDSKETLPLTAQVVKKVNQAPPLSGKIILPNKESNINKENNINIDAGSNEPAARQAVLIAADPAETTAFHTDAQLHYQQRLKEHAKLHGKTGPRKFQTIEQKRKFDQLYSALLTHYNGNAQAATAELDACMDYCFEHARNSRGQTLSTLNTWVNNLRKPRAATRKKRGGRLMTQEEMQQHAEVYTHE